MKLSGFILLIFLPSYLCKTFIKKSKSENSVLASVTWSKTNGYQFEDGYSSSTDTVVWANYKNAINETGWGYLEIKTNKQFPDKIQAYAAGLIEGRLTSQIIYWSWINTVSNYCKDKEEICKKIKAYLHTNINWVKTKIKEKGKKSPYWHHVALFYEQIRGITKGYQQAVQHENVFAAEILKKKYNGYVNDSMVIDYLEAIGPHLGAGKCSALVKVLEGNKDLYFSHVSWNGYNTMLRILKKYTFGYHWTDSNGPHHKLIPGNSISFSSYPGVIYSGDDFHLMSSGLATVETSNMNVNHTSYSLVKPRGQLLEGVRVTVANRLARSGKEWTKIFSKHNSGTYNNQWMVVDYKLFKPGQPLKNGLFWVAEQLPGIVHSEDMTWFLKKENYWPSYNVPYFKDIYQMSGYADLTNKYGKFFTYDKTFRAQIFERDHGKVKDVDSLIRFMRYNNFLKDPLSICEKCIPQHNGVGAISARLDLNPVNGTYPFKFVQHNAMGGLDMKATTYEMFQKQEFIAIGGPTYDDLPPFQWSKYDSMGNNISHVGHPDLWVFKPIWHQWTMK